MNVPVVLKARKPSDEPFPRVAVEACFLKSDGTPVDFDSVGEAGVQGPKGDKGDPGPQGPAGKDGAPGVTQAATASALGLVKKASGASAVSAADAAQAAADAPTKAEFDKAVAVANECKAKFNALVDALRAAGVAE